MSFKPCTHFIQTHFELFKKAISENNIPLAEKQLQLAYREIQNLPGNHILWSYYYLNHATICNNQGIFDRSIQSCLKAQKTIPLKGYEDIKAQTESNMAAAYLNLGKYPSALQHTNIAIQLYQRCNRKEQTAEELITKGTILLRTDRWDKAIKYVSQALAIGKRENYPKIEAKAYMQIGFIFRAHHFLYLAIDHYRDAERIFRNLNYNHGIIDALYERANTWISLGNPDETVNLIKQLEPLTPEGSPMYFFTLKLWFCIYNQREEFEKALDCAEKLLQFFSNANDKVGIANSLENIGSVYYNLRNMDEAIKYGQEALDLATDIGDKLLQSISRQLIYSAQNYSEND